MMIINNLLSHLIKKIAAWSQRDLVIIAVTCLLSAIVLLPMWRADLVADDTALLYRHTAAQIYQQWWPSLRAAIASGRIHLSTHFMIVGWPLLIYRSTLCAHLLTLIMVITNIILWHIFCRRAFKAQQWLAYSTIFLPLLWQIRPYHDPFLVYYGTFQLYFSLFLLSNLFLISYWQKNKISLAIWSIIFFWLAVNAHEAIIMFLPIQVLLFWARQKKFISRKSWPIFVNATSAISSLFMAKILQVILRIAPAATAVSYDGTTISFSLKNIFSTWLTQIAGALPLNFLMGRVGQESLSYYQYLWLDNLAILFLSLIIFGVLFYYVYQAAKSDTLTRQSTVSWLWAISIGAALWILPALPVAVSAKYQTDLLLWGMRGGIAYLMVYYQYFGVSILLAGCFYLWQIVSENVLHLSYACHTFVIRVSYICLTLLASFIFYATYVSNSAAVGQVNKAYGDYQRLWAAAASNGFFDNLRDQTVNWYLVQRDQNYYAVNNHCQFMYVTLQRIISDAQFGQLLCSDNLTSSKIAELHPHSATYYLYSDQTGEHDGYIILAAIDGWTSDLQPLGSSFQIYYTGTHLNDNWPGGIYPVLRRDLAVSYQTNESNQQLSWQAQKQWLSRDRQYNYAVAEFSSDTPVLLNSIVPQIIQVDRPVSE